MNTIQTIEAQTDEEIQNAKNENFRRDVLAGFPSKRNASAIDEEAFMRLETEAEAKALWDSSQKLRDEFKRFEYFRGYWRGVRSGLVSIYGIGRTPKRKSA